MKKKIIFLSLTFLCFLNACKYQCPSFPESKLIYIPYEMNDTLKYSNGIDTIVFVVSEYYQTEKHTFSTAFPIMDLWCEEKANYKTDQNLKVGCFISESYDEYELFEVKFNELNKFTFSLSDKSVFEGGIIKEEFSDQLEINGRLYHNCITVEKNTLYNLIWKIVKADSVGIVEFYHNDYQDPWVLLN